jgi:choline-sulfatase
MVRLGRYKYIYVHEHDERLFDVVDDPEEWHDLARLEQYAGTVHELRALITEHFDPDALAAAGAESIRRRLILRAAMRHNDTHWDYQPHVDARHQYVR